MNPDQAALLSSIADDLKALKGNVGTLQATVNGLENKLVANLRGLIREETKKFGNEIELMKGRMDNMEARFSELMGDSASGSDTFSCNRSVIIINLVELDHEDPVVVCQALFSQVLGIEVTVTKAERLRSRNDRPGLIKCELTSLAEKITVLRNKRKVSNNDQTKDIYIARMKSHEERLIHNNVKTMLKELPNGNQYKFTGSGRLIHKSNEDESGDDQPHGAGPGVAADLAPGRNRGGEETSERTSTRTTRGSVSEGRGRGGNQNRRRGGSRGR